MQSEEVGQFALEDGQGFCCPKCFLFTLENGKDVYHAASYGPLGISDRVMAHLIRSYEQKIKQPSMAKYLLGSAGPQRCFKTVDSTDWNK